MEIGRGNKISVLAYWGDCDDKVNMEVKMEVFEAIKTRRSIRHYKSEAVGEEKLNAVL